MNKSIFALTNNGAELGRRICKGIGNSLLYLPERFIYLYPKISPKKSTNLSDIIFFKDFKKEVERSFKKSDGIIFIMATGIVVRAIAPFLKNKVEDPAVVVLDEKGRYAISLLSGHLGGANDLTKRVAALIDAEPVITTATDVNSLHCIEDIAKRFNCAIEDYKKIKLVNSQIVNGGRLVFVDKDIKRFKAIKGFIPEIFNRGMAGEDSNFYKYIHSSKIKTEDKKMREGVFVIISNKSNISPSLSHILLRPKELIVGIGCDRGVRLKEVEDAYFKILEEHNISPLSVRNIASIDIKNDEKELISFAKKHSLNIEFYSKEEMKDMPLPSGHSKFVMGKVGIGGVCEPAALKSAGTKKIWIKKQKIGRVTIAIAKAP